MVAIAVVLAEAAVRTHYGSLSIAENEQSHARVYAGLNYIEGCYAGIRSGNQVAGFVYDNFLKPLD